MSRETSFVAVEVRETPVLGDMQLRRVPIALTAGWGGLERDDRCRPSRRFSVMDTSAAFLAAPGIGGGPGDYDGAEQGMPQVMRSRALSRADLPSAMLRGLVRLRTWRRGALLSGAGATPDHFTPSGMVVISSPPS